MSLPGTGAPPKLKQGSCVLQKYSAESAGQPALEITPSAGFPPREVRVETGSHTSGPHTLLFWDKGSPPGAACRGRGGTVPSSSCWRAVRPRSRTALPPPPPFYQVICSVTLRRQALFPASGSSQTPDPRAQGICSAASMLRHHADQCPLAVRWGQTGGRSVL